MGIGIRFITWERYNKKLVIKVPKSFYTEQSRFLLHTKHQHKIFTTVVANIPGPKNFFRDPGVSFQKICKLQKDCEFMNFTQSVWWLWNLLLVLPIQKLLQKNFRWKRDYRELFIDLIGPYTYGDTYSDEFIPKTEIKNEIQYKIWKVVLTKKHLNKTFWFVRNAK